MALYQIYNGASPTTAALAPVTTGTAIKTLLQIKPGTQNKAKVKEWGISFDGSAAATPIKCELIETDVAATVTAHVAAGIVLLGDPNDVDPTTSNIILTTTGTGYTATVEGRRRLHGCWTTSSSPRPISTSSSSRWASSRW
jgi:hypothetical protein